MVTPDARRDAVAYLCAVHGVSQRRACNVPAVDRSSVRYRSVRPNDAAVRAAMKEVAAERRRFGYQRLFILLRREGEPSGINRIYRLYREEGLTVRKRRARRRAVGTRAPILVEARPDARWSLASSGAPQVRKALCPDRGHLREHLNETQDSPNNWREAGSQVRSGGRLL
jgi:transposase InsO family protein